MMFPQNAAILIPQKEPFIMIGELLSADDNHATTSYTITRDNVLVANGVFQEGGLLENMAQTAAAHAGYLAGLSGEAVRPGFIVSVKNFEIHHLPVTGETLITKIENDGQVFGMTTITGQVLRNNKLLAKCELKVLIQGDND